MTYRAALAAKNLTLLTKPPVPYELIIGVPISHLLIMINIRLAYCLNSWRLFRDCETSILASVRGTATYQHKHRRVIGFTLATCHTDTIYLNIQLVK